MNTPLVRPADDNEPYGDPIVTSRDLDALVAKKVMGWENVGVKPMYSLAGGDFGQPTTLEPDGVAMRGNPPNAPEYAREQHVPNYSTDITAAWLIVEKFGREGWALHLAANRHENPPAGEECRAVFWSRGRVSQSVYASTTPVAICRAALAAVEHAPPPSRADD